MDHPLTYRQRHADRGCRLRRARPGPNLPPKRPLQITPRPWRTVTKPHPTHPTHDGVLRRPLEPEMGFAVHVPHYLAQAGFPPAAEALLAAVGRATGLSLPIGSLSE